MDDHAADGGYRRPPVERNERGDIRSVGFEIEFSGIKVDEAAEVLRDTMGGKITTRNAAEVSIEVDQLGTFSVELDWTFLKEKAAEQGADREDWIEWMRDAAAIVVPVEVVCPPVGIDQMAVLDPLVAGLRQAGAVGTEDSLLAAYGVHINPEIPEMNPGTLFGYLRAFALLQWWLADNIKVDTSRELSPFIALYGEDFVKAVASMKQPSHQEILDLYLEHNATRNRALDLLPILASLDEERIRSELKGAKVSTRPTFHYRLADCHIQSADWSLADAWNPWCIIEECAARPRQLEALAAEFLEADRRVLGVNRKRWVERTGQWLRSQQLG